MGHYPAETWIPLGVVVVVVVLQAAYIQVPGDLWEEEIFIDLSMRSWDVVCVSLLSKH